MVDAPQRGFGSACWVGLQAATAEVVCFMDCDGSLDPAELPRGGRSGGGRIGPIWCWGPAGPKRGAWPVHARWANRWLARRIRRRYGYALTDLGPMRAARRQGVVDLGLQDRRSGWPLEMVLRAGNAGWRVDEVAVAYGARQGRSKVTGTVGGTLRAVSRHAPPAGRADLTPVDRHDRNGAVAKAATPSSKPT